MAENIATVVNWYGPFTGSDPVDLLKRAQAAAKKDFAIKGLYAAVGYKGPIRRGPRTLLYVGVGNPLADRLVPRHHRLGTISLESLWLGEVDVPGIPGRRKKRIDPHLDAVEWSLAYFLEILHNVRKRRTPPPVSCVVLNRWWRKDDYETETPRPVARWPDLVEYDSWRGTANLVWFGKRARVKTLAQ